MSAPHPQTEQILDLYSQGQSQALITRLLDLSSRDAASNVVRRAREAGDDRALRRRVAPQPAPKPSDPNTLTIHAVTRMVPIYGSEMCVPVSVARVTCIDGALA